MLPSSQVRPLWVAKTVDAVQVLTGRVNQHDLESVRQALTEFAHRCAPPPTMAESLILRGILLKPSCVLESTLDECLSSRPREAARTRLHRAAPTAPLAALLDAIRQMGAAAHQSRSLPVHERAYQWIRNHLSEPLSVSEMAARVGAHRRTLNRAVVKHVGTTVR